VRLAGGDPREAERSFSPVQLGFDLSNVGALISPELAYENTSRILTAGAARNLDVVLSMENSGFVPGILAPRRPTRDGLRRPPGWRA